MFRWFNLRCAFMAHHNRSPKVSKPSAIGLAEERLGASISSWLKATAELESLTSDANTRVRQRLDVLQASISLAQDTVPPGSAVAQPALKRKIDCAEEYHQAAHRFNGIVEQIASVVALVRPLAKILDAMRLREPTLMIAPVPQDGNESSEHDRFWVASQLEKLTLDVDQLGSQGSGLSGRRISVCVATLGSVVKHLSFRAGAISDELCRLSAVIDKIDREIVLTQIALQ